MIVKIFVVQKKVDGEFVNIYPSLEQWIANNKKEELTQISIEKGSHVDYRVVEYDATETQIHKRDPQVQPL